MARFPDRTGIFIYQLCTLLAGAILGALVAAGAFTAAPPRDFLDSLFYTLARALGFVPSLVLAVALPAPGAVWFARAFRDYRAQVKEDRRRAGLE